MKTVTQLHRNVVEYAKRLLQERRQTLQELDLAYQRGFVKTCDYTSSRRALVRAIGELETLLTANVEAESPSVEPR